MLTKIKPWSGLDAKLGHTANNGFQQTPGSLLTAKTETVRGIGVYREIVPPERIVSTDAFADAEGDPLPPSHYGMSESHPAETLVTVTFTEHEGKTKLTPRRSVPESVEEREGTQLGWIEMLDRLGDDLAAVRPGRASS